MTDRPTHEAEIEVTPEMIEAGTAAYAADDHMDLAETVEAIYRAMASVKTERLLDGCL